LLDILRGCLLGERAIAAAMGQKVRVAIGDKECEITNSTTDAELEAFIQKIVRTKVIRPKENFFRKKGRYWDFAYQRAEGRVQDLKGVRYDVILLRHPFELIHSSRSIRLAHDHSIPPEAEVYSRMSAAQLQGEGLSPQTQPFADRSMLEETRKSYQKTQERLKCQLADAIKRKDSKLERKLESDLEAVETELSRLTWKGKLVHHSMREEKDRKSVEHCIERAHRAISKENAYLGQHLEAYINKGEFCSYTPDRPITWE
jgi:hypothetical protein